MQKNKKLVVIICAVLAVLIAAFAIIYFATREAPAEGAKEITFTVVHADKSEKVFELHTDAEYLGEVLKVENIVAGDEGEFGLYIHTADGETADAEKQEWWCLTKGGEALNTGADMTVIHDGDAYELTFTAGW